MDHQGSPQKSGLYDANFIRNSKTSEAFSSKSRIKQTGPYFSQHYTGSPSSQHSRTKRKKKTRREEIKWLLFSDDTPVKNENSKYSIGKLLYKK